MSEDPSAHRNGEPVTRLSLMERLSRLEAKHEEQGELLAEALGEIRRLRTCLTKVKAKRNGALPQAESAQRPEGA